MAWGTCESFARSCTGARLGLGRARGTLALGRAFPPSAKAHTGMGVAAAALRKPLRDWHRTAVTGMLPLRPLHPVLSVRNARAELSLPRAPSMAPGPAQQLCIRRIHLGVLGGVSFVFIRVFEFSPPPPALLALGVARGQPHPDGAPPHPPPLAACLGPDSLHWLSCGVPSARSPLSHGPLAPPPGPLLLPPGHGHSRVPWKASGSFERLRSLFIITVPRPAALGPDPETLL